jgi:peptidoglycan hydrolase-like protein with peptidoglycan-binding domain
VTINGGAPQTNSVNVTLALTALAGMNQMWISNDYSFATSTGTGWIPFQTTYPWTLTSGFGNKTVYVEFKNANLTASAGSAEASLTVGVGGGTGGTSVTTVTTTGGGTSGSSSAAQLQLLNTLIAQLRLLLQQALAQGMTLPPGAAQFLTGTTGTMFTRDLSLGSQGEDVRQLQIYLNAHGFPVAASGAGSLGNETTYFGPATQAALAAFQKSAGISPASGYFGPKTRASLIGGTAAAPTVSAPPTPIPTSSPLQASQPPMFIAIFPLTKDLSYGVTDPEVAALQTFLAEDSAIYPQGFVTGYYGSATEHAVQKFQLAENIPASGAVDVMTRVELNQLYLSGDKP